MKSLKILSTSFLLVFASISSSFAVNIEQDKIRDHISKYNKAQYPSGRTVYVCSGHGCSTIHEFTFDFKFLEELKGMFVGVLTPDEERAALRKAIAFIEKNVGKATGTEKDRASLGAFGAGDPSQMDCVDEATNSTSYLIILNKIGALKFHDIMAPNWKGGLFKWTHYAAVIKDRQTKILWAIDSGVGDNGKPPLITPYSKWYE